MNKEFVFPKSAFCLKQLMCFIMYKWMCLYSSEVHRCSWVWELWCSMLTSVVIWHYDNDNPTSDTKWLWCIYGCVYFINVHHYNDDQSMFVSINCSLTGVWYKAKNSLFHRFYKIPTSPSVILFLTLSLTCLWHHSWYDTSLMMINLCLCVFVLKETLSWCACSRRTART